MDQAEQYRRNADEAERLARQSVTQTERDAYEKIAGAILSKRNIAGRSAGPSDYQPGLRASHRQKRRRVAGVLTSVRLQTALATERVTKGSPCPLPTIFNAQSRLNWMHAELRLRRNGRRCWKSLSSGVIWRVGPKRASGRRPYDGPRRLETRRLGVARPIRIAGGLGSQKNTRGFVTGIEKRPRTVPGPLRRRSDQMAAPP